MVVVGLGTSSGFGRGCVVDSRPGGFSFEWADGWGVGFDRPDSDHSPSQGTLAWGGKDLDGGFRWFRGCCWA